MPEYKRVKDIEPEEINEQIKLRKQLISSMVGSLYPAMLQGEIERLEDIKQELLGEGNYGL